MVQQILLIFHIVLVFSLVALVLVQQGKGAGMGVSLGAGASQTVFGSRGAGGFLLKLTCGLAALFFATCLILTHMTNSWAKKQHNMIAAVKPLAPPSQSAPHRKISVANSTSAVAAHSPPASSVKTVSSS